MSRSRPRLEPAAASNPVTTEPALPTALSWRVVLGLLWFIAFSVWFYGFGIPNGGPLSRWVVWSMLPFDLLDILDPPFDPQAAPWSWLYLGQRVPFLLTASVIWLGAWGLGSLTLRGLGLHTGATGEGLRSPVLSDEQEKEHWRPKAAASGTPCEILDSAERLFFAGCLGLSGVSLAMLGLGLLGVMSRWPLLVVLLLPVAVELLLKRKCRLSAVSGADVRDAAREPSGGRLARIILCVVAPFVLCMLLGAMSPQTDFDVVEYHLGGPKEWLQQGRIARLPHNVYTSFPFLTELLLLCGMVLQGDWEWGGLAGQAALAGFVPLTAIGLFATGRRWFSSAAGSFAALIWLTAPWAYRISIIAYAEGGLACYLFAALAVGLRLVWSDGEWAVGSGQWVRLRLVVLCGLLAGSAMACKYTGVVSVVLPLGVMIGWKSAVSAGAISQRAKRTVLELSLLGAGVLLAVGPWLVKNTVETGNPVFPLAWSIFGGEGRDAEMDAQWRSGHGAKVYASASHRLSDLLVKLTDISANNDWHSPLMFGLAPIALLAVWRRRVWYVWAFIGWQFLSWFWLTHHIDRFYVPMLPAVALLAGAGAAWLSSTRAGRWCGGMLIVTGCLYNAWIMKELGGFNAGRIDLRAARDIAVSPSIAWLNAEWDSGRMPREAKVLCVGEAALFHAHFPYVYNTVFDRSRFEAWFAERTGSGEFRIRPSDDIRATLRQHGITHVLVNWSEILRYLEPGSYGYTRFAHPSRFAELQAAGILDAPLPLPDSVTLQKTGGDRHKQIRKWAFELLITVDGKPAFVAVQVFPVKL